MVRLMVRLMVSLMVRLMMRLMVRLMVGLMVRLMGGIYPTPTKHYQPIPIQNLDKAPRALKKFVWGGVGWWGGLFDYSVYSWPRFCQGQG